MAINMNNLILCGFMGCGKSTIGRHLAKQLQYTFIDMDRHIERVTGLSVPVIFERLGESCFRDIEHQICKELSDFHECVIATGGGAVNYSRNVQVLKEHNTIIFLNCPFPICYERICNSTRPLVAQNSKEQLFQLYLDRLENYRGCCDLEVNSSGELYQIVQHIIQQLNR